MPGIQQQSKMKEIILVIFMMLLAEYSALSTTDITALTDPYFTEGVTTCSDLMCINGEDAGSCEYNCSCDVNGTDFFLGSHCEHILFNEDIVQVSTSARTANFTWPDPPNIDVERYNFVYWKEDDPLTVNLDDFNMITTTTARITGLDSGTVKYQVCVANSTVVDSESIDFYVSNDTCLYVETQEGGMDEAFTISAIVAGCFLIVSVVTVITLKLILDGIQNHKEYKMKQGYDDKKVKEKLKKEKPVVQEKSKMTTVAGMTGYANEDSLNDITDGNRMSQSLPYGIENKEGNGMEPTENIYEVPNIGNPDYEDHSSYTGIRSQGLSGAGYKASGYLADSQSLERYQGGSNCDTGREYPQRDHLGSANPTRDKDIRIEEQPVNDDGYRMRQSLPYGIEVKEDDQLAPMKHIYEGPDTRHPLYKEDNLSFTGYHSDRLSGAGYQASGYLADSPSLERHHSNNFESGTKYLHRDYPDSARPTREEDVRFKEQSNWSSNMDYHDRDYFGRTSDDNHRYDRGDDLEWESYHRDNHHQGLFKPRDYTGLDDPRMQPQLKSEDPEMPRPDY